MRSPDAAANIESVRLMKGKELPDWPTVFPALPLPGCTVYGQAAPVADTVDSIAKTLAGNGMHRNCENFLIGGYPQITGGRR